MGAHPVASSLLARRAAAAAVAALAAVGLATAAGTAPAGAELQPSVTQVKAKINKLTNQENYLIQRYDNVSQELSAASQQLKLVKHEVVTDQANLRSSRAEVAAMAAAAYEDGSLTSDAALLTTAKPQAILNQSAILVHLSTSRQEQLQQYLTAYQELLNAQHMAQRARSAIAKLHGQLAAQKRHLESLIAQQQSLLSNLTAQQQSTLIGGGGSSSSSSGGGSYNGPTKTQGEQAVAFAYQQLGCPYVYGATGPCGSGFDCSGLTQAAWASAGVSIPRTSYGQATLPSVPMSQIQPGDILEFAGDDHVGIYVGNGYLIDAPQPGMNVEKVSLSSSWYAQNLDGAVRP